MFAPLFQVRRTAHLGRRSFRPTLESLESRSLPSTLTVTNLSDGNPGSLRDAITQAAPGDMINFAAGLQGTITLTTGELTITKSLDIEGPGAAQIAVSGNNAFRVFDISPGVHATLAGLTITNGQVKASSNTSDVFVFGGGIYNAGTLTMSNCAVSGNFAESDIVNNNGYLMLAYSYGGGLFNSGTASVSDCSLTGNTATYRFSSSGSNSIVVDGGHGAAIDNAGVLTLSDSRLDGNTAAGYGGALYNSGQAAVTGSTFSNNTAINGGGGTSTPVNTDVYGGGIDNDQGSLAMTNCTVANNQVISSLNLSGATGRTISSGGGVYSLGELSMISCTVAGNSVSATILQGSSVALAQGGGVYIDPSSPHGGQLVNTIVSGNSSNMLGPDAFGPFASLGHNLIGKADDSSGWVAADLTGTKANPLDPLLGPLQDNGGPTQTMALLAGSPAIDAGDNNYFPGPYDQRGDGFARIVNGTIDIGAFEVQNGGNRPAAPRERGRLDVSLGQEQLAVRLGDAVSPMSRPLVDEPAPQRPVWENTSSAAQSKTVPGSILGRYVLDAYFANPKEGQYMDPHLLGALSPVPTLVVN
jgi:hypothetical protein